MFYHDTPQNTFSYALALLKAMCGLVDAPVLWSIALRHFIIHDLCGKASRYDDNFIYWTGGIEGREAHASQTNPMLVAAATIHVDDLVVAASRSWLSWAYDQFLR